MSKLHFEIIIQAKPMQVWDAIVNDGKYKEWTSAFNPTSYFEGGWNQGDRIRFLGISENGEKEGMVAEIAESTPYSYISIRHLGFVQGEHEDTTSDAVKAWLPAYENYSFIDLGTGTKFVVETDAEDRFEADFKEMWPKALVKLKNVAER